MNQLSFNIKKYRQLKSMTQEQLGNRIGVSGQAVSKWEKGSMPDASILPMLADALDISIDCLYGRQQYDTNDIPSQIISYLTASNETSFDTAYRIAWISAVCGLHTKELFEIVGTETPVLEKLRGKDQLGQLESKAGFLVSNFTLETQFLMLVNKHGEDFRDFLMPTENYAKFFSILADEKTISILLVFYHKKSGVLIFPETIANIIHLSLKDTTKRLEKLYACNILYREMILQDDIEKYAYTSYESLFILALLILAKSIYNSDTITINYSND